MALKFLNNGYFAGKVGIGITTPTSKLHINQNVTDPDLDFPSSFAVEIDSNHSGSAATTGDREQGGLYIDVDSSTTGGDTSNEHRLYGIYNTVNHSGDSDIVYANYSLAEQNTTAGTTTNLFAVNATAISDGGANADVTNMVAVYGVASMQDATPVGNSHAGKFLNNSISNRAGSTSNTYGISAEIQIDSTSVHTNLFAGRFSIDSNAVYTATNSYLLYLDYQGASLATNIYSIYSPDDVKSYHEGDFGIGTTSPTQKLHVAGNLRVTEAYYDSNNTPGTSGQILSSTVTGTDWIDQGTISAESAEVVEVPVKNVHTATILKGVPVYIFGSVGSSGRLEVKPADASVAGSMPALGLLKQDLAVNAEGLCVITGKLRNLITSPIDGVTTNDGDVVYVKAGGGLTTTKPTGSANLIQNMGKVGVSSTSNNGTFVVSSILRSNDVPNLTTGKIWVGDGNTIESSVVFLDEPNGRMGIGTTSPDTTLEVLTSSTTAYATSTDEFNLTGSDLLYLRNDDNTTQNNFTSIFFRTDGSSGAFTSRFGTLNENSGAGSFVWMMRDSSHTGSIDEKMRLTSGGDLDIARNFSADSGTASHRLRSSITTGAVLQVRPLGTRTGITPIIQYRHTETGGIKYLMAGTGGTYFGNYNSGIPTDVSSMIRLSSDNSNNPSIGIGDSGSGTAHLDIGGNVLITNSGDSYLNGGNVGIGTISPNKKLEVSAATDTTISIASSDTSINVGQNIGILEFASNNETSLSQAYTPFSKIKTISESAVSGTGSVNGAITFETADANVISERMRINSAGAIQFNAYDSTNNTGTPTYLLGTDASGNVVKTLSTPGGDPGPYLPLAGGTMTGTGSIVMPDDFKLQLGNGIFSIFNDGTYSIIRSANEPLLIDSNGITFRGYAPYNTLATITSSGISIKSALLSNQENTDVDTGTETVASVAIATYTAAFFDFVIKKTTNVRSGTVYACHDGTNVEFTETSTQDLGDTSDVTLSVDISGTDMRLRATTTSDDWSIKSLIRAI